MQTKKKKKLMVNFKQRKLKTNNSGANTWVTNGPGKQNLLNYKKLKPIGVPNFIPVPGNKKKTRHLVFTYSLTKLIFFIFLIN